MDKKIQSFFIIFIKSSVKTIREQRGVPLSFTIPVIGSSFKNLNSDESNFYWKTDKVGNGMRDFIRNNENFKKKFFCDRSLRLYGVVGKLFAESLIDKSGKPERHSNFCNGVFNRIDKDEQGISMDKQFFYQVFTNKMDSRSVKPKDVRSILPKFGWKLVGRKEVLMIGISKYSTMRGYF